MYFFSKYDVIECKYIWKHVEKGAGCCWSPAWTPSAKATRCSTASLSCLSDWHGQQPCESPCKPNLHRPGPRSAAESIKPSLLAAAAPTLPAAPWQEVTPVQARVLLTPSVTRGLIPGSNCRDGQTLSDPATSTSPSQVTPDLLNLGTLQGEIRAEPEFSSSCPRYVAEEVRFFQVLAPDPGAAAEERLCSSDTPI